jgi:hypothetical protein
MEHEDLSALTWGFDAVPNFQPGLILDNPFELEDMLSPLQLQPALSSQAAPSAPPNALSETKTEQACVSQATTPSCQPDFALNMQMLATSPVQASRLSYSESSTIPEDQSEAVTGGEIGGDGGGAQSFAADRGPSRKRRRIFSPDGSPIYDRLLLEDLRGTTAAQSRLMTEDERDLMLHKRRLRNRASAARSREKQRSSIQQLSTQVEDLNSALLSLRKNYIDQQTEIRSLREQNNALRAALSARSNIF